ncbi:MULTISPECIES: hypothetical protein [Nocardia]|uniref:hypothetical protein n=1 Tax=Nocardia TaxID=1817 RepID=UPI000D6989CD|nr:MULTISPECIES: hypothetical protein [Nocardia]
MTTPSSPVPQSAPSQEEDDHDLLTYGIAGDRLREEIELEIDRLETAIATGRDDDADRNRSRIRDLEAAFSRHTSARDREFDEKRFFGEHVEDDKPSP